MLFLCINNKVAKKFRYYAIPESQETIAALATCLGVPPADDAESFAESAVAALRDGNAVEAWSDVLEPESSDPWDIAKELRYRHSQMGAARGNQ